MTEKKTSAIAVIETDFAALALPDERIESLIKGNLTGEGLTQEDIDRIKIPSGGITQWSVPSIDGDPEMVKELEGVVVYQKLVRAYWEKSLDDGGASAPDCKSDDNSAGFGSPGGYCRECLLSKFGSAVDKKGNPAKGQACKLMMLVFLMGDSIIPQIVVLPPTSVGPMRKYLVRLTTKTILASEAVTKLALEVDSNDAGIKYSKVKPSIVGMLNEEAKKKINLFIESFQAMWETEGIKDDDIGSQGTPPEGSEE